MTDWPDLAAIEALVAVADHGSIAAAARATAMAQPNVSRSIARLERRFHLQLLARSTTGAHLNPDGELVVGWARTVLAAAGELTDGVAALAREPVTLTIAASHTIAENLLPGWVAALRLTHPHTRVRIEVHNSTQAVELVRGGGCDVGFVEGPDAPRGLHHRIVGHDELVLVAPPGHPLTGRSDPLPLADLAQWPLVTRERGSGTRVALDQALRRCGRPPVVPVQEAAGNATVRVAVLSGAGLAVLSRLAVDQALAAGLLVEVGLDPPLRRPFRAVWAGPAQPGGAVLDVLDAVRTCDAGRVGAR